MTTTDLELSISAMAEATGLTVHTLRYYERAGLLLTPIERASSSHRRYSSADVDWVVFLGRLRSTGMPIRVLRQYVEQVRGGDATTRARLSLLLEHRERVLASLAEVQLSLAAIDRKISMYSGLIGDTEGNHHS